MDITTNETEEQTLEIKQSLRLQKLRAKTNPRALKRAIHQKLDRIYQLAEEDERRKA